jgi:hypothetical protein
MAERGVFVDHSTLHPPCVRIVVASISPRMTRNGATRKNATNEKIAGI